MSQQKVVIEKNVPIGGWVTVIHNKFNGYDKKQPIKVDGSNYTYFPKKFKKPSILAWFKHNLLTTDGRDFFHAQCYVETAANTTIGSQYIALTNDSGAPAAGDTTLASEITTNGLGRAQATTITHTDNTNGTTLAKTFTATGTQSAQKSGLFNASSAGIMSHEATMTSASLVNGDTLAVTWNLTLG